MDFRHYHTKKFRTVLEHLLRKKKAKDELVDKVWPPLLGGHEMTKAWQDYFGVYSRVQRVLGNKTDQWLDAENPMLGNVSPRDMMCNDKTEKLLEFIKTCQH